MILKILDVSAKDVLMYGEHDVADAILAYDPDVIVWHGNTSYHNELIEAVSSILFINDSERGIDFLLNAILDPVVRGKNDVYTQYVRRGVR